MFGKKEGFKYEVEVKALIREATEGLNHRISVLETQNQLLIQELSQLKNGIFNDFQRLEKRITDFTDVWHPFMIQNINRIKEDLEKTIIETEREDIKKVHADLKSKLKQISEESSVGLMDNILVGYYRDYSPVFAHKDSDIHQITAKLRGDRGDYNCSILIFESLKHFKKALYDPAMFQHLKIINKSGNILYEIPAGYASHIGIPVEYLIQNQQVKNIYKLCKEYGIKFVINGEDRVNGIPIKILFEDE
jgi:hypothetical protein